LRRFLPQQLSDPAFVKPLERLRDFSPHKPMIMETHESAISDAAEITSLWSAWNELKIGWA